tara:strand:- start:807 stop:1910 length:1104 start_codon:yes stop_codon:yes gene_type:complete
MFKKKLILFNSASSVDLVGGSQRSIDYLIVNLHKIYDIYYFCWNFKNNNFEILKFKNYTLLKIPHPKNNFISFLKNFPGMIKIFKNLTKKKSILWVHSPLPFFLFSFLVNKNLEQLYSVHGPLLTEINYTRSRKINSYLLNFIYKIVTHNSKKIIFNSFYTLTTSMNESEFLHNKNLTINELLVDEKYFIKEVRLSNFSKKNFHNGNFFIIPRRLVKRTGVHLFLKEVIKKKINLKFKFYITGEGDEEAIIKDTCNKHKNLYFLGSIDQNLLTFLLKISKGVIIPSIEAEGYCIVAKEARLLNKYVIHTNQGGLRESLAGYNLQKIFKFNELTLKTFQKSKIKFNSNSYLFEKNTSFSERLKEILII